MQKLMEKHRKAMKNGGFSLVELIIVIAIMAALVAILAPQYMKYVDKSRKQADATTADDIFTACKLAATDETVKAGFTVTWTGAVVTVTSSDTAKMTDATIQGIIATNLGEGTYTNGGIPLVAKYTGTLSPSYEVTYTLSGASSSVQVDTTNKGWW